MSYVSQYVVHVVVVVVAVLLLYLRVFNVLQKCADNIVSDKRVYYTFARTLPPSTKVSKSVVALLQAFKWSKFVVVAGKSPVWGLQIKEAIKVILYHFHNESVPFLSCFCFFVIFSSLIFYPYLFVSEPLIINLPWIVFKTLVIRLLIVLSLKTWDYGHHQA